MQASKQTDKENQAPPNKLPHRLKLNSIISQILEASSIQKEVAKSLKKLYNRGKQSLNAEEKTLLQVYAKQILEVINYQKLMDQLQLDSQKSDFSFFDFMQIIKYYMLNQSEKEYVDKIVTEIEMNEKLQREVDELAKGVDEENKKRMAPEIAENADTKKLNKEIESYENKLEKAHQKLNYTIFQNSKLREKIDLLRKEKSIVEEIYKTLKTELEDKKELIEKTITEAGRAHINRNIAETELKNLMDKAKQQKEEYEMEYEAINEEIQHDKKFCEFLREKQNEKQKLEQLEKEIRKNQEYIRRKTLENDQISKDYQESAKKELEIREAFEKIRKETGINSFEDLLPLFQNLHNKNNTIKLYVKELNEELEELDRKIEHLKESIKMYHIQGSSANAEKNQAKLELAKKIEEEKKKKEILQIQHKKSLETIEKIKECLLELFKTLEIDEQQVENLKNCAITSENLLQFFGLLEDKGIKIISEYSKFIAEQIKMDKGDHNEVNDQINHLLNIIEYENKESLAEQAIMQTNTGEFPDHLFDNEGLEGVTYANFRNYDELRQQAIEELWKGPKSTKGASYHQNNYSIKKSVRKRN